MAANSLERRLQIAGTVLLIGLAVEVLTLFGKGAVAFLVFTGFCVTLIGAGILLYLLGVVSSAPHEKHDVGQSKF
jgi:hypothetical protein